MSNENLIILAVNLSSPNSGFAYTNKIPEIGSQRQAGFSKRAVYYLINFVGSVKIQGTLTKNPTEDDWFDITENHRMQQNLKFYQEKQGFIK